MKYRKWLGAVPIFVILILVFYGSNLFADDCGGSSTGNSSEPSGPSAPSTAPSGGDGGSANDQLGKTFDPKSGEGGMGPMLPPDNGGGGTSDHKKLPLDLKNPLNHGLVKQYLKEVNKLVKQHGEYLKNKARQNQELQQRIATMEEGIKSQREYVDLKLRNYGNAMTEQLKARAHTKELSDKLFGITQQRVVPNLEHSKWSELVSQESKLSIQLMDAVVKEKISDNVMKMASDGLEFSLKDLNSAIQQYEQTTAGTSGAGAEGGGHHTLPR